MLSVSILLCSFSRTMALCCQSRFPACTDSLPPLPHFDTPLPLSHACSLTHLNISTPSSATTAPVTGVPASAHSLVASLCREETRPSSGGTSAGTARRSHWNAGREQADHAHSAAERYSNMCVPPSFAPTARTSPCTTRSCCRLSKRAPASSCPSRRCAATAERSSEPSRRRARREQQRRVSTCIHRRGSAALCLTCSTLTKLLLCPLLFSVCRDV